jgi:type I restriction enzyme R subunit
MDRRGRHAEGWLSQEGHRGVSQFAFLQHEWGAVFEAAAKSETAVHADPRTTCFYAGRALELAVSWARTSTMPR